MADPAVYLAPIPILVGLGQVFPEVEHWCNVIVGGGFVAGTVGGLLYLAWQWWGPLPERDGESCLKRTEEVMTRD
jgi:hypothetical protein